MFYDMKKKKKKDGLCDVTIRISNRSFVGHRIILSAAIPYFHAMFTSNLAESQEKVITMKELDPEALGILIDFAYTSKVNITTENVQALLVASEFLQLTQVRDSCCDFLFKRLDPSNVMQIRRLADSMNCLNLVKNSDCYIREHFDDFCETKEFLSLSFSFLNELIRRDDLRVKSEEKVFESVMNWVKSDTTRHSKLYELLTGIRMTLLTPEFLIKAVSKEKLIMESTPCRNLLDEAKHYHLLPDEMASCITFTMSERMYETPKCVMYIFCCNSSTGLSVLKYIPNTRKLTTLLNDRMRRNVNHVLALGEQIYVFQNNGSFELFNPLKQAWSTRQAYPDIYRPARYAIPYGGKIYLLAGRQYGSNACYFDHEQNRWIGEGQYVQFDVAELVASEQGIYILGTENSQPCEHTPINAAVLLLVQNGDRSGSQNSQPCSSGTTNKIYNPQTGRVTQISDMCTKRKAFGCAALNGKIYACGGRDVCNRNAVGSPYSKTCEVYDPSEGQWRTISPMGTAREDFSLVPYNQKLYAIGGMSTSATNEIECYDPSTGKWTSSGRLDGKYDFVKAVVVTS